ncbi:hypothetical protein AAHE18_20G025500 [Arachis hypogaea]
MAATECIVVQQLQFSLQVYCLPHLRCVHENLPHQASCASIRGIKSLKTPQLPSLCFSFLLPFQATISHSYKCLLCKTHFQSFLRQFQAQCSPWFPWLLSLKLCSDLWNTTWQAQNQ